MTTLEELIKKLEAIRNRPLTKAELEEAEKILKQVPPSDPPTDDGHVAPEVLKEIENRAKGIIAYNTPKSREDTGFDPVQPPAYLQGLPWKSELFIDELREYFIYEDKWKMGFRSMERAIRIKRALRSWLEKGGDPDDPRISRIVSRLYEHRRRIPKKLRVGP